MRITHIELDAVHVNHRGEWIFVHVFTDAGVRGIGEMFAGTNYQPQVASLRKLGEWLVGRDPTRIDSFDAEWPGNRNHRPDVHARSAVEQAMWDISGKSAGVPVHTLLGGKVRDELRLYANINRATTDRTPEGFSASARMAVSESFDAIKLAPFDSMPGNLNSAAEAAKGIDCIIAVREAIGPEIDLLVDCHSHFTIKGSLELADALRHLGLYWFEQPTPEANTDACLEVKERCGMRIAGGEQRMFEEDWTEVMERKTLDVIMPDVNVVGGMGKLRKVANMAAAVGIPTAPHGPYGPVTIAAHAHAMAGFGQFEILEFGWGEVPWRAELTDPPEGIIGGHIMLNDRPGLGITLNPYVADAHRVNLT